MKYNTLSLITSLATICLLFQCCRHKEGYISNSKGYTKTSIVKSQVYAEAGVVTAHPIASEIGAKIMKQGGNAIDAAIAIQFALAVVYPVAGNIGGGGFMIVRMDNGTTDALDYREVAPAKAHPDMYLDKKGDVIDNLSLRGHLASGVPGSVDGMYSAFEKYSKLKDWSTLILPSIKLAENGFQITNLQAKRFNKFRDVMLQTNSHSTPITSKEVWKAGDLFIQTELASTLKNIMKNGRAGFYNGPVADLLVDEMTRNNGIISHADLANYSSVWRTPIIGNYRDHTIISMPPPSSGGIALVQLLESIEPYPISDYGFQSVEAIHLMVEAERRVYADRATHLGDSDFYDIPVSKLINPDYNKSRMQDFDATKASKSKITKASNFSESEETTHFSIIDPEGNAVSVTTTLNTNYGSKVYVKGGGFFLNNEMDDFSIKPGVPNFYGLIGNEVNKIEPNKRMLSSMTPTIVSKNDKVYLVTGTPGGSTIITSVFQIVSNIIDHNMSAKDATHACRFHHQWLPDLIYHEKDCVDNTTRKNLISLGHTLKERENIGRVETILVLDNKIECAADNRGDDSVSGY